MSAGVFLASFKVKGASLVAQMVKNLPAGQVHSLGQEDPLEKGVATHSSLPAWRIPGTEEPGWDKGQQDVEILPPSGTIWTCKTWPRASHRSGSAMVSLTLDEGPHPSTEAGREKKRGKGESKREGEGGPPGLPTWSGT